MTCKSCYREFKRYNFIDTGFCYPCSEKRRLAVAEKNRLKNDRIKRIKKLALAKFMEAR